MEVKLFEVRDRGTLMPVVAIRCSPANEGERWLLARGGYGLSAPVQGEFVLLAGIESLPRQINYDPFCWDQGGTLFTAHKYVAANWDNLKTGDVICTEYIRGERDAPKTTERLDYDGTGCQSGNAD